MASDVASIIPIQVQVSLSHRSRLRPTAEEFRPRENEDKDKKPDKCDAVPSTKRQYNNKYRRQNRKQHEGKGQKQPSQGQQHQQPQQEQKYHNENQNKQQQQEQPQQNQQYHRKKRDNQQRHYAHSHSQNQSKNQAPQKRQNHHHIQQHHNNDPENNQHLQQQEQQQQQQQNQNNQQQPHHPQNQHQKQKNDHQTQKSNYHNHNNQNQKQSHSRDNNNSSPSRQDRRIGDGRGRHHYRRGGRGGRGRGPRGRHLSKGKFWRDVVGDAVDPISLDSLVDLDYPPFALVIEPPYVVVEEDVFLHPKNNNNKNKKEEDGKKNNLHLFDGRVLAYYMISQRQFIDPLNRRDLSRPELEALDLYLQRHNLTSSRNMVVDAYLAQGTTVSRAGSSVQTQAGRELMRREEATSILHSIFASSGYHGSQHQAGAVPSSSQLSQGGRSSDTFRQDFEREYLERHGGGGSNHSSHAQPTPQQQQPQPQPDEFGPEGRDSGFILIDDNLHPGLRGVSSMSGISRQRQESQVDERFPSLPPATMSSAPVEGTSAAAVAAPTANATTTVITKNKISKSLAAISKSVPKTDPAELARQKKATLEMKRRAALSQLTLADCTAPTTMSMSMSMNTATSTATATTITGIGDATGASRLEEVPVTTTTEGQRQRNRSLAEALKIDTTEDDVVPYDGVASYPQSLLSRAASVYGGQFLSKLERRWLAFVSASAENNNSNNNNNNNAIHTGGINLPPMPKPQRAFVHEYSDFWFLDTQSFDPDPHRYVRCRRTVHTRIPRPLLSQAVRSWKPTPAVALPPPPPPPLSESAMPTGIPSGRTPLKLEPRTVPLDLPPPSHENNNSNNNSDDAGTIKFLEKRRTQKQKALEQERRKRNVLEEAFASDDDSDWGETEPLYGRGHEDDDVWSLPL